MNFEVNKKFQEIFSTRQRFIALSGGRGSGKSYVLGEKLIYDALQNPHLNIACLRQVQKSIKHSSKKLLETLIQSMNVSKFFKILKTEILILNSNGDECGCIIFNGLQDYTVDNIASLYGFNLVWIEEARSVTYYALSILEPTIREKDAQIMFSWNPKHEDDEIETFLNELNPEDVLRIHTSYLDNKYIDSSFIKTADYIKSTNVAIYNHRYLGDYLTDDELAIVKRAWLNACIVTDNSFRVGNNTVGGFDVADTGGDTNTLIRRDGNTITSIDEWTFREDMATESVKRVIKQLPIDSVVNYDAIGIGRSTGSIAKFLQTQIAFNAVTTSSRAITKPHILADIISHDVKHTDTFLNLKAQIYFTVANMIYNSYRRVVLNEDVPLRDCIFILDTVDKIPELFTEMLRLRRRTDLEKLAIEKKSDMLQRFKSPNLADGFMLACFDSGAVFGKTRKNTMRIF